MRVALCCFQVLAVMVKTLPDWCLVRNKELDFRV